MTAPCPSASTCRPPRSRRWAPATPTLSFSDRSRRSASTRSGRRTAFLHAYYGPRFDVDQSAIFGPPREVAAQLSEHVSPGITQLVLGVPTLDLHHLGRLAAEVAPVVRASARP